MDYEVQRCTRCCARSGRELLPEEPFYSVLIAEGAEPRRLDYAAEAWQGPPQGAIGWWKSRIPSPAKRQRWAPNDVMLRFFDELAEQPEMGDMRYVLALLLARRRVMRQEESERDASGHEIAVLYCPRRDATYKVPVVIPDDARANEIQEELAKLLQ